MLKSYVELTNLQCLSILFTYVLWGEVWYVAKRLTFVMNPPNFVFLLTILFCFPEYEVSYPIDVTLIRVYLFLESMIFL